MYAQGISRLFSLARACTETTAMPGEAWEHTRSPPTENTIQSRCSRDVQGTHAVSVRLHNLVQGQA